MTQTQQAPCSDLEPTLNNSNETKAIESTKTKTARQQKKIYKKNEREKKEYDTTEISSSQKNRVQKSTKKSEHCPPANSTTKTETNQNSMTSLKLSQLWKITSLLH
jgi:hypothetical protein